ncbi:MAG: 23S rRNA (uracil(1939)-C(5))-methyltransferase RlmD [Dethiosulfovibrio sp.]|nr:23S rRNA (uracil(1939)-C(5))-methyltransferase RlmD [Dethiosulfovibrio sp.]
MKEKVLTIRDLNSNGQGVALCDSGKVIFVDKALPGEKVRVSIVQEKKNYGRAALLEIETPSVDRIQPKCQWYEACGGCQVQHASYSLQIAMKKNMVRSAMERIGGVEIKDFECVPSDREWGYRNKASFPVRWGRDGGIGFFRPESHSIVSIDNCPVLMTAINDFYSKFKDTVMSGFFDRGFLYDEKRHSGLLRHIVMRSNEKNELLLMLVASELNRARMASLEKAMERDYRDQLLSMAWNVNDKKGNRIIGDRMASVWGENIITERLGDFSLSYDGTAFFQVNTLQAEKLFTLAAQWADSPGGKLVELYSGVGALTSFLAKSAKSVLAIEEWGPSIDRLKENMSNNGIDNVRGICGRAEDLTRSVVEEKPDVIVVDPPRSGCLPEVLDSITESSASKTVYVSCNPATLARDTAFLIRSGWGLKDIKSFDLFPQTCHVETVACFTR